MVKSRSLTISIDACMHRFRYAHGGDEHGGAYLGGDHVDPSVDFVQAF